MGPPTLDRYEVNAGEIANLGWLLFRLLVGGLVGRWPGCPEFRE